ncbi:MAG: crosslink repair DNA glycosylase YcaQ family protein [Chloroflexota bacterium]|nr:crosslink repair DNA glycosylase YcaQ family protein [Chloroflexota bacterium]
MEGDARRVGIMSARPIAPATARRLAISAQHLDAGASPFARRPMPDADSLYAVIRDLGCLQLDPISAVARSHLLVLWSRVGVYDPALLDDLHFRQRKLFEYWAHEASIVLTEDYPLHAQRMRGYAQDDSAWSAGVREWVLANDDVRRHILDYLEKNGASLSRHLQSEGIEPTQWVSSGWTNGRNVTRMLDYLWMRGDIMVSARVGGQKQWDLAQRVLPDWAPRDQLDAHAVTRRAALKAIRALGVATANQIKKHYIRGRYPTLATALAELEREGQIARLKIDGLPGDWLIAADDLPRLEAIESEQWAGRTILLSPFDNLICDRDRARLLFGFDFTIEIYVPAAKRKYGYYVLPILHGDRLIGRVDPGYDRKTSTLTVANIYAERDAVKVAPRTTAKAIGAAIESLGTFLSAQQIVVGAVPSGWERIRS